MTNVRPPAKTTPVAPGTELPHKFCVCCDRVVTEANKSARQDAQGHVWMECVCGSTLFYKARKPTEEAH